MRQGLLLLTVVALMSGTAAAQMSMERERARPEYKKGWDFMRGEDWPTPRSPFSRRSKQIASSRMPTKASVPPRCG